MAVIRPFRAVRPDAAVAPSVSSVPYDVVSTEEARHLASGNPLSFLHVTRSEIDLPVDTDPYSDAVYARAAANFAALRDAAPLISEAEPSLYLYRLRMDDHQQTGVAGCFSVDEYERDVIKKHERTRRDKEDDRTRHIIELRAQTGVVFLTYKASAGVTSIAAVLTGESPLYDFTAADGVQHTIWKADARQSAELVDVFTRIPALYIADGHHRAASAARARAELRTRGDVGDADMFVAVAFPDDQVQILPYNRIVSDLGAHTPDGFLAALRERRVPVQHGKPRPAAKRHVSMYLAGRWYDLDLSEVQPADRSHAAALDVARLQHHVLEPLLGIGDVRTDKRIDFIGGARGTSALEAAVDQGRAAVAFSMYPVTIDDLIAISDEGAIMPPKSTWFEPKLRDGLLTHVI
ncbi:MAG TPA: DUF1015 family protein [Vicinamibacterales bacterium]|jgi:uncharacterized protein (DUF1015 family)|nr:DUF1015 family protein [Vicinamibacterales bacterium]